jgi:hypothetical protein
VWTFCNAESNSCTTVTKRAPSPVSTLIVTEESQSARVMLTALCLKLEVSLCNFTDATEQSKFGECVEAYARREVRDLAIETELRALHFTLSHSLPDCQKKGSVVGSSNT